MTSSPVNPDHLSVSFNLLAEVFHERNEIELEAKCLGAVIGNHPILPDMWTRLGRAYSEMSRKDRRKKFYAAAAFFRGLELLKSVEKTVSDFVKEINVSSQQRIKQEIESLNLDSQMLDRISELVAKNLKSEEPDETGVTEFEDLGKSARLKSIEDSFRKIDESIDDGSIVLPDLINFEAKMFHFLAEIN
jgi:hypothetical protein